MVPVLRANEELPMFSQNPVIIVKLPLPSVYTNKTASVGNF